MVQASWHMTQPHIRHLRGWAATVIPLLPQTGGFFLGPSNGRQTVKWLGTAACTTTLATNHCMCGTTLVIVTQDALSPMQS
jgi:hypothetical protein